MPVMKSKILSSRIYLVPSTNTHYACFFIEIDNELKNINSSLDLRENIKSIFNNMEPDNIDKTDLWIPNFDFRGVDTSVHKNAYNENVEFKVKIFFFIYFIDE